MVPTYGKRGFKTVCNGETARYSALLASIIPPGELSRIQHDLQPHFDGSIARTNPRPLLFENSEACQGAPKKMATRVHTACDGRETMKSSQNALSVALQASKTDIGAVLKIHLPGHPFPEGSLDAAARNARLCDSAIQSAPRHTSAYNLRQILVVKTSVLTSHRFRCEGRMQQKGFRFRRELA